MTKSYYKVIDGVRYDREMLDVAEEAMAGKGDGRISKEDAEKLFQAIIDGNMITEIELQTLDYIRETFNFTPAAEEWLQQELENWKTNKAKEEATGSSSGETVTIKKTETKPGAGKADATTGNPKRTREFRAADPIKPVSIPPQKPEPPKLSIFSWKVLALVFLILIPIAFFLGRGTTPAGEDRLSTMTTKELEATLEANEQEMIALKSKIETMTSQLADREIEPVPAATASDSEHDRLRNRIADAIENRLGKRLAEGSVQFDRNNLLLTLIPSQTHFEKGSAVLNPAIKTVLAQIFPELVGELSDFKKEPVDIRFQGHSSSAWKYATGPEDAYLKNMSLSTARSEAALTYCLGLPEVEQHKPWLADHMLSAGFSDLKPAFSKGSTEEDPQRSRRITISIVTEIAP